MPTKYLLKKTLDNGDIEEKEYKTLKEISNELGIEQHITRKIYYMTEGITNSKKPHHSNRELYDRLKISSIKKSI